MQLSSTSLKKPLSAGYLTVDIKDSKKGVDVTKRGVWEETSNAIQQKCTKCHTIEVQYINSMQQKCTKCHSTEVYKMPYNRSVQNAIQQKCTKCHSTEVHKMPFNKSAQNVR